MIYRRPDPDRDLPDPGVDDDGACVDCGEPVDDPRMLTCDRCHHGVDDYDDDRPWDLDDEPDDREHDESLAAGDED